MSKVRDFPRPTLLASRCLGFDSCRYNGLTIRSDFIRELEGYVKFITPCPEADAGLGTPRKPLRLVRGGGGVRLIQPATGKDVTGLVDGFSKKYVKGVEDVDGVVLKNRSPSCGIKDVRLYEKVDKPNSKKAGVGVFAARVMERFFKRPVEDEGRLRNSGIRDDFLIKLFTWADFKRVRDCKRIAGLMDFHARNKMLFMAYNQAKMRKMGNALAGHSQKTQRKAFEEYEDLMVNVFEKPLKPASAINSLTHAMGYFKDVLKEKEKKHFLELLEEYRDDRIPLRALTEILLTWAIRYENDYILSQSLFNPYPRRLTRIDA